MGRRIVGVLMHSHTGVVVSVLAFARRGLMCMVLAIGGCLLRLECAVLVLFLKLRAVFAVLFASLTWSLHHTRTCWPAPDGV